MKNSDANFIIKPHVDDKVIGRKGIYLSDIALLMFVSFILSQRWFDLVIQSSILQIAICFIVLILLLIRPRENKHINFSYTSIDLTWLFAIVIVLVNIAYVGIAEYNTQFFMYSIGIVFLFLAKANIVQFTPSLLFIKYVAMGYAFATIGHYLFTNVFHSVIFAIVPFAVQARTLELVATGYYPGLGFAQPAISAGYMIIGMGVLISFWEFRSKRGKILDVIYALILLLGIIMVGKRSFILWGLITLLITYYALSSKKQKLSRIITLSIGMVFGLFSLYIILNYFESVPFFNRITETITGIIAGEDVTSGRIVLYEGAWNLFKDNPIFGIGWEQFEIITSGWFFSRDLSVHNVYLQLLTEIGLFGFIAVMIPLLYVFIKTFKILKLLISQIIDYNYLWKIGITFSFYYQIFFLLYCLTENPFYNVIFMLMYFFSISIVSSFLAINFTKLKNGIQ